MSWRYANQKTVNIRISHMDCAFCFLRASVATIEFELCISVFRSFCRMIWKFVQRNVIAFPLLRVEELGFSWFSAYCLIHHIMMSSHWWKFHIMRDDYGESFFSFLVSIRQMKVLSDEYNDDDVMRKNEDAAINVKFTKCQSFETWTQALSSVLFIRLYLVQHINALSFDFLISISNLSNSYFISLQVIYIWCDHAATEEMNCAAFTRALNFDWKREDYRTNNRILSTENRQRR